MSFQGTGFGYYPWGHFAFGHSDFGEDAVVRSFPDDYMEEERSSGRVEYIKHYLTTIKEGMNEVKKNIDVLEDQIDFTKVREDIIEYLGSTVGVQVDDSEPIDFRRSLVGNTVPLARIKGTKKSYDIRGKISGFNVNVKKLYKLDAYNLNLIQMFNPENIFNIPSGSDQYLTDLAPGSVSGTPIEDGCGYCLTSFISIEFTLAKPQPPNSGTESYFDRLIRKLRDIIPIHVRDVLFEFRVVIFINEHDNLFVEAEPRDVLHVPTGVFYRFDVFPADMVPCDDRGYITGTIDDTGT